MSDRSEKTLLIDADKNKKNAHFHKSLDEDSCNDVWNEVDTCKTSKHTVCNSSTKQPSDRRSVAIACAGILATELCERMTYYAIMANLILYLTTRLSFSTPDANTIVMIFAGTCYFVPVVGGWLADSVSGKFNVIYGSGLVYIVGVFLVAVTAVEFHEIFGPEMTMDIPSKTGYFMTGLLLVAVGSGGIKANVGPYGADQVDQSGPAAVQTFFIWFYWFINMGSFISFIGIAYIQQNISFCIGFVISLASMVIAVIAFQLARKFYINTPPTGSVVSQSMSAIVEGIRRRKRLPSSRECFIDSAKTTHGGSHSEVTVEGVKAVARLIPILFTLIIYWCIYAQMSTTYFTQTLRLNVQIGSFEPPVASLNLFNVIIILILIPLMDRVIYPLLQKYGRQPTLLQRMGFGFFLVGLSVIVAGVVEIYRKRDIALTGGVEQIIGGERYLASRLSMFIQAPQFILIGASEIFSSIASLEFAYSQSPAEMKGLIMGLSLLMTGLGNYISSLIIIIIRAASFKDQWFPDEINNGHIEYVFFLYGGLMFVDLIVFIFLARWYEYIQDRPLTSGSSSWSSTGTDLVDSPLDTPKPSVSDFPSDKNEFTHF